MILSGTDTLVSERILFQTTLISCLSQTLHAQPLELQKATTRWDLTPGLHRLDPFLPLHPYRQTHHRHWCSDPALAATLRRVDQPARIAICGWGDEFRRGRDCISSSGSQGLSVSTGPQAVFRASSNESFISGSDVEPSVQAMMPDIAVPQRPLRISLQPSRRLAYRL